MRRATVLPMTLYALALIGALVVGTQYITRRLAADARLAERGSLLEPAVEGLLVNAVATWDTVARSGQPVGSTAGLPAALPGTPGDLWVTRLSPSLYWLVAQATVGPTPVLRRRAGVFVTVDSGVAGLVSGRAWGELP